MALTQVRAKLGDVWTVLTYNAATGRYEGTLTPPGTSIHQPGGYYSITVEATNQTGQTDTLSGTQYKGLRLVVRETVSPALTLVSPPPGWLTTASPSFVFRAQDEAGGSGIGPDSARASIDGASVPCAVSEAAGVYTLTVSASGLSEGPHTVTVSISDRDGNETTASAAYIVDTVPPSVTIISPGLHRVVDWETVEVSGYAGDATSGLAAVDVAGMPVEVDSSGRFSVILPLKVGENEIAIKATDSAGLSNTQNIWMLRLITDRTRADVDTAETLLPKAWDSFTAAEQAFWMGVVRGAYNSDDMNRVGTAVAYIAAHLQQAGYTPQVEPKTDWTEADTPTPEQRRTYLDNVTALQALLPLDGPPLPPDMEALDTGQANDIETVLVSADRLFPLMERSGWQCGEIMAGEN